MKKLLPVLLSLAAAPGCVGQAGTETGNPPLAAVQLSLSANDVPVAQALTADPATGVRVDEVWLVVDRVKFVQADVCDTPVENEADLRGPLALELAAEPVLFDLQLPEGDYCRVRVRLERAEGGQGPADLLDHSVLVRGVRGDGAPFTIRTRIAPDVDVRSRTAPFPLGDALAAVVLAFDAKRWVAAVDLDAAVPAAGGILIDRDSNRELLDAFELAMGRGLSLHEDLDQDGTLDEGEETPLADSD